MRVVHVVTAFPRHEGDVITPWLVRLLLGLRDAGVDAAVLAPAYRGGGATEWRGIPVRRFRYAPSFLETLTHDQTVPDRLRSRPWAAGLLPAYMAGGSVASVRMGVAEPPDVVHVHWPVPHAWFGGIARAATDGAAALVSTFYSVEIRWIERRLPWAVPLLRWSVEASDAVTAISSSTAAALGRYTGRDVPVIPFSASLSATRSGAGAAVAAGAGRLRILFVGRLVERKGVPALIRALALVRERLDATLEIIGDGESAAQLRSEAARAGVAAAVAFRGQVDERALQEAYERAELLVLPAVVDSKGDTEGLGVVLLEALEFGLPVVASEVGGIPDIIRHRETGLLVPPGEPASLAEAILEVAADPGAARERALRGRREVRERFGMQGIVDRLLACYRDAMAARRGETRCAVP